ncbi:MAG: hypothetical protein Kow0077_00350 [Anaerolineae bacterium]
MTGSTPQRPNYFELLDLDPDAPWSDSAFLARLDQKKAEWTRGRNHPKHALRYKSYLDMVPDIQATLLDPVKRSAEQAAARTLLNEKHVQARQQFAEELELRAAKGFLTQSELDVLLRDYGPTLGQQTVRAEVEALRITIRPDDGAQNQRETLDSATMQAIASNLAIVGEENLYTFLGLARSTRTTDLHDRAAQVYADNQKQATKTAVVTARSDLAGQAMKVFAGDEMRRRYDAALDEAAFAGLGEAIQRITRGSRTIHPAQYVKLLERARADGLNLDEAEAFIRRRAQELQAALFVTDAEPVARLQRCPACESLADPEAANCPTCGTPLRIPCPACKQDMPTANQACTHCGFPVGNLPNVEALLAEAHARFEAGDPDSAARLVQEARRQWSPAGIPQALDDPLSQALIGLQGEIAALQDLQAELLTELQRHIDERLFYGAREIVRRIEHMLPTLDIAGQRRTIDEALARTEAALEEARQADRRGEDVVEHYQQILWDCRDCQAARDALAQTPPAPPETLSVTVSSRVVRLQWESSPSAGVAYTVVRRTGTWPVAPGDGEQLATLPGTTFDDTDVPPGLPVYYAVYANREGVLSTEAARSTAPVLLTAEVTHLTAQIDDGLVRLRWQAPPNAIRVEVRRGEERPPRTLDEGHRLRVFGLNDSVDTGLQNGHTYYYTVFAVFQAADGQAIASEGVSIRATPQTPPAPITDLDIRARRRGKQRELHISWAPLTKGEAVLVHSPAPPPLQAGIVIPQETLTAYGEVIAAPRNEAVLPLPGGGVVYLTPAILFQEMAYIGATQVYTALEDVRNVRARNLGFALELHWDWPEGCRTALVAYHHTHFPAASDPDAARITVTRAEYDRQGRFLIQQPAPVDYYIAVYAAVPRDNTVLFSPGREPSSRVRISLSSRITVSYTLSQARRLRGRGPVTLTITAEGTGTLPEMVVIHRLDRLPIRRDDGVPVLRIAPQVLDAPQTILTAELDGSTGGYFRLFLSDDSAYEARNGHVRLLLPPDEYYQPASPERGGLLDGLTGGDSLITCPFCFTRFSPAEAMFRCTNPRCQGRAEDPTYAEYQGLMSSPTMGRVFVGSAENGSRRRTRPARSATCPDCAQLTHQRVCPTCHYELLYDAGQTEERTIAILGGRGTGKSNYIAMLINRLENDIGAHLNAGVRALGDRTRERYERDFYTPLFRRNQVIPPTRTAGVDISTRTPLVFRITFSSGKVANLVIFDTAGEDMQSLEAISTEARYLLFADALIFLLDPLQISAVRERIATRDLPPIDPGAEPEYIVGRLRELYDQEFGLRTRDRITKPVAFTLSKVDMLYPLLDPGSGLFRTGEHFDGLNLRDLGSVHAEIAAYLRAWLGPRFDTLVRTNFANYHYFGVSSFGKPPEGPAGQQTIASAAPIRVEDPILWIFYAFGLIKGRR